MKERIQLSLCTQPTKLGLTISLLLISQQSLAYEYISASGIQKKQTTVISVKPSNTASSFQQQALNANFHKPNSYNKMSPKKRLKKQRQKAKTKIHNRCFRKNKYQKIIQRLSLRYQVDIKLVTAVIAAESCFNPKAVSPKGAQGLMQLMPFTAKRFGVNNSFDPMQNIMGGVKYLRFLTDYFKGDIRLAVAAYNAGEGAVKHYHGVPPYKETKNYVVKVLNSMGQQYLFSSAESHIKGQQVKPPNNIRKAKQTLRATAIKNSHYSINEGKQQRMKQERNKHKKCLATRQLRKVTYTVFEGSSIKRYYLPKQGELLSNVAKVTGLNGNDLAKLNNFKASLLPSSLPSNLLVWECRFSM